MKVEWGMRRKKGGDGRMEDKRKEERVGRMKDDRKAGKRRQNEG